MPRPDSPLRTSDFLGLDDATATTIDEHAASLLKKLITTVNNSIMVV